MDNFWTTFSIVKIFALDFADSDSTQAQNIGIKNPRALGTN